MKNTDKTAFENNTVRALKKAFEGDLTQYRPVPFWSWNSELDEGELVRQIEDMHAAGLGGFIIHARTGLSTEYLGEKWFSCVGASLEAARRLGMRAWIYDENGWPSGFVGGKLLENEDFRARFLTKKVTAHFDAEAFCVYVREGREYRRVTSSVDGADEYFCVYLGVSPANTDILRRDVVTEFLRLTHEQYYARFSESFGRELVGFFTDEPQCYRAQTPYSHELEEPFLEKYASDVRDGLIYLFEATEESYAFKTRYYSLMNELYVERFYKRIYEWCESHGCMLTGHSIDEASLGGIMLGSCGVMPTYEYEHIPAIDWLGRDCHNALAPKQVASVASQLGKRQVMTETFACSGNDVTPKELRGIGDFQFFNGVSLLCHHLYPYSIAGQGKHDHPPVFSSHSGWSENFGDFNEYFTRLGYIVSNTDEDTDLLIIHPRTSVYADYIKEQDGASVAELDASFSTLLDELRRYGVRYHLADEDMLKKYGSAEGEWLTVGKCRYNTVLVPRMKNVAESTLSLLRGFEGRLVKLGDPELVDGVRTAVSIHSNTSLKDVTAKTRTRFFCEEGRAEMTSRKGELGCFVFIKNYSRTEGARIRIEGASRKYRALDLLTLKLTDVTDTMTLEACEGIILIEDATAKAVERSEETRDVTDDFYTASIGENTLVLDTASYSTDGKTFSDVLPLPEIFERLLRRDENGKVYLRHTFRVSKQMPLTVMLEKNRYIYRRLNGQDIEFGQSDFDLNFEVSDVTAHVTAGENVLEYCLDYYQHEGVGFALFHPLATESLRNCLYYDTHIENVYVRGDFALDATHVISPRGTYLPPVCASLNLHGFPFFMGRVTLEGEYFYDGKGKRELELIGRFVSARIETASGSESLCYDTKRDITHLLRRGSNHIRITLSSSLRNMMGPLHYAPVYEPTAVGPYCFTMRGSWKDGTSHHYTPEYQTVPFGVDRIIVKSVK